MPRVLGSDPRDAVRTVLTLGDILCTDTRPVTRLPQINESMKPFRNLVGHGLYQISKLQHEFQGKLRVGFC